MKSLKTLHVDTDHQMEEQCSSVVIVIDIACTSLSLFVKNLRFLTIVRHCTKVKLQFLNMFETEEKTNKLVLEIKRSGN